MKKNKNSYKKMWLLLAGMIVSALLASLAFTSLIYSVSPQFGTLLIAGGALLSLIIWMALAVITLERAYEPGRPTRLSATTVQSELKPGVVKS